MTGGSRMAKAGMRRPDVAEPHGTEGQQRLHIERNEVEPVPEIQGKAKADYHCCKLNYRHNILQGIFL